MIGEPCTLRSTSWDGPAPSPGDLITTRAGSWYVVAAVAEGAGVGHYRLDVVRHGKQRPPEADDRERRIFRWRWARRYPRTKP